MINIKIKNNRGLTLIISMVILVSILFLTMTSMNRSVLNQNIATNMQSKQQAEMAAQAAVQEAEQMILNTPPDISEFSDDCTSGLCKQGNGKGIWKNQDKWSKSKAAGKSIKEQSNIIETPEYVIEYLGEKEQTESISVGSEYGDNQDNSSNSIYRITGKSKGKTGEKETVIQSTIY